MRRVCKSAPCLEGNAGIGAYQSQTQYLEKNIRVLRSGNKSASEQQQNRNMLSFCCRFTAVMLSICCGYVVVPMLFCCGSVVVPLQSETGLLR